MHDFQDDLLEEHHAVTRLFDWLVDTDVKQTAGATWSQALSHFVKKHPKELTEQMGKLSLMNQAFGAKHGIRQPPPKPTEEKRHV